MFDQWEAQVLAMILVRAKVALFSALPADDVRRGHMDYIANLDTYLAALMRRLGNNAPVAVLPDGPLTSIFQRFSPRRFDGRLSDRVISPRLSDVCPTRPSMNYLKPPK